MPVPTAGIAVLLGSSATPILPHSDPATLSLFGATGIDPIQLAPPTSASICLRLTGQTGWERLNLAALIAAARARPGAPVEIRPAGQPQPLARAVHGPLARLDQPAAWRLQWPGPRRPTTALLDRDGTLIEDRHYLADPEGVTLLPGAAEGLRSLAAAGLRLVVVTNQSGVAASRIRPVELAAVHARLRSLLIAQGVQLDGIFACTHHPDAGCTCRKPADGLARQAAERLDLDLGRALVAGDKDADLGLGRRLGVPTFLMATGEGAKTLTAGGPPADYMVEDLRELARVIIHPAGLGVPHLIDGAGAPPHG